MEALALPGVYAWHRWQPDRGLFFSSHLFVREGGNVAIDPLALDGAEAAQIEALGGVRTILLTNRDHARGAAAMRERFGARVLASRREAELFELPVDGVFDPQVPAMRSVRAPADAEVAPGITAIPLDGAKTPGEVVFFARDCRAAIVGDALWGAPAGALSLMSDEKLGDPQALVLSLRRLWMLQPKALLLGDGASLFAGVDEALGALLESRGGPAVNRINLDELDWEHFDMHGGKYAGESGEIGLMIGARGLGYRAVKLPPGKYFCPLHAHDWGEEVFYAVEGTPTIRTPRGDLSLRPGDFVAFPVGDRGAHQVLNESSAPCTLILFGSDLPEETVYYPDSNKVLIRCRDLIVRAEPLDYYDGE